MNRRLITTAWLVCIMLTLLTSCWPMFDNTYLIAIWGLSAITALIATDMTLTNVNYVDTDTQLSCEIITIMCVLFTTVSVLVVVWELFSETNDNLSTLAKCMICSLAPIGFITERIASWKPKE